MVELTGPDTRRFANGMFTPNARDAAVGAVLRGAWCDDRGRIQGVMDLGIEADDHLVAVIEGQPAQAFVDRFGTFIVFDDVELAVDEARRRFTLQGADAARVLAAAGWDPEAAWQRRGDSLAFRRARSPAGGFDLLLADGASESLHAAGALEGDAHALEVARILHAEPRYPDDFVGLTFPHELPAIAEQILDYDKGCYVGQEVINRMRTRGQVRKALVPVRGDGPLPEPGTTLQHAGKKGGALTSVLADGDGWIGLAKVRKPADAPDTVLTGPAGDCRVLAPTSWPSVAR